MLYDVSTNMIQFFSTTRPPLSAPLPFGPGRTFLLRSRLVGTVSLRLRRTQFGKQSWSFSGRYGLMRKCRAFFGLLRRISPKSPH